MNICRPFGLTIQRNTWSTSCPEIKPNIGQLSISSVEDWNRTLHLVEEFGQHASASWVGVLAVVPCPVFPPGCPPGRHCANPPPPQGYTLCVSRENQPGKQDKKLFSAQSRKLSFFHLRLFQLVFLFTVLLIFSAFPPALRPQTMYMRVIEVFTVRPV